MPELSWAGVDDIRPPPCPPDQLGAVGGQGADEAGEGGPGGGELGAGQGQAASFHSGTITDPNSDRISADPNLDRISADPNSDRMG